MAGKTRTIRKVHRARVADFDDQLWPVNVALVILGGFIGGLIVANSHWDDPRLIYNTYFRLAMLGGSLGLAFWAVFYLQGRIRRRILFCAVLSLLFHLWLAFYASDKYLAIMAEREAKRLAELELVEPYEQIVVPDYHWEDIEEPEVKQFTERPIATPLPRPAPPETRPQETETPDVTPEVEPIEQPEMPRQERPTPTESRRAEVSAPRRANSASGVRISRQERKHHLHPNEPAPEPTPVMRSETPTTAIAQPNTSSPTRRTETPDPAQPTVSTNTLEQAGVSTAPMIARRTVDRTEPSRASTTPRLTRQTQSATDVARTDTAIPETVDVTSSEALTVQAESAVPTTPQRRTAIPTIVQVTESQQPALSENVTASASSARISRNSSDSVAARQAVRTPRSRQVASPVEMSDARVEQIATAASVSSANEVTTPNVTSRASRETSQIAQEQPASEALSGMTQETQLPATMAPRREARVATADRQAESTRAMAARPSTLARHDTGSMLPSTAIPSETAPATSSAASGRATPSQIAALASNAAVRRSAAQPEAGSTSVPAGNAEMALGTSQVVARRGQPRMTGRSEPSSRITAMAPRLARNGGSAALATAASSLPQAATSTGQFAANSDRSNTPSFNMRATAARRGGHVSREAMQIHGAGPATDSGTAGPIGSTQARRVTRETSLDSLVAGGGRPKPGRTSGGANAPNTVAERTVVNESGSQGGEASRSPAEMPTSGPQRQLAGLPGSLQSQPSAGAIASLTETGLALPGAAARRATTAGSRGSSGRDSGVARSVTMRRSTKGTELPAAATAVETSLTDPAKSGADGLATTQGGLPSQLQAGPNSTIRREAANVNTGQQTAATGLSESSLGASTAVAMAGRLRASGDNTPQLSGVSRRARVGRSLLAPAVAGSQTGDAASPQPGTVAEGQSSEVGEEAGPTGEAALQVAISGLARDTVGMKSKVAQNAGADSAPDRTTALPAPTTNSGARRSLQGNEGMAAVAAPVGRRVSRGGVAAKIEASSVAVASPLATSGEGAPTNAGANVAEHLTGLPDRLGQTEHNRSEGGLPVQIAALDGPGGLAYETSFDVGLPSRRARPESEIVHTIAQRFIVERSGGQIAIDGRIDEEPTEPFRQRSRENRDEAVQAFGGSEGTEKAVEMGLEYLARTQFSDGHWSIDALPESFESDTADDDPQLGQMTSDTAATGLAMLAYLGAGYTHHDDKYRSVVAAGLDWLVRHQRDDGDLFSESGGTKYAWFYSHGIAAIALCEAYGMTRDPELREPARKAVDFIIRSQDPKRGGWRYYVDASGAATDSDTSVTGWQVMALKSAQMAGLDVPDEAFEAVAKWLDYAHSTRDVGRYAYRPHAQNTPEQRHGRQPSLAMTAEAMLMRMYLGDDRENEELQAGAAYLDDNLPRWGTKRSPQRDCYYWYYATQAMFHMQGDHWKAWNDRFHPLLEESQIESGSYAGSWDPKAPLPDRWGHSGGRHYVTAMHLLMLEVYSRHMPLYRLSE